MGKDACRCHSSSASQPEPLGTGCRTAATINDALDDLRHNHDTPFATPELNALLSLQLQQGSASPIMASAADNRALPISTYLDPASSRASYTRNDASENTEANDTC